MEIPRFVMGIPISRSGRESGSEIIPIRESGRVRGGVSEIIPGIALADP